MFSIMVTSNISSSKALAKYELGLGMDLKELGRGLIELGI